MKTRTTKSPCAVYSDNDLATEAATAAQDLTGKRDAKQEVVWNLGSTPERQCCGLCNST